jgi:hypothetical protein
MGKCEAKLSSTSKVIGQEIKFDEFEWHKNPRVPKTLNGTLENPNLCPM